VVRRTNGSGEYMGEEPVQEGCWWGTSLGENPVEERCWRGAQGDGV